MKSLGTQVTLPCEIAFCGSASLHEAALNRHPDLSATARRVALELLNHINRATGTAWPSEARMAEALSITTRSIRRAKAELAALGLLTWQRRGTSKAGRTNVYRLALAALLSLATRIKAKVKAAATAALAPHNAQVSRTCPGALCMPL